MKTLAEQITQRKQLRERAERIERERQARERDARERLRKHEDGVLRAAAQPDASAHTRAAAEQIRDHRAAGNYTTQHH